MVYQVLTIAGSDSSGGAGIQADLKTFSALGVYGASVITALTAQNTQGVSAIHTPPASFITAQCDAVFSDLNIHAVKLGMLANAEIIHACAAALQRWQPPYVVLDTVMISKSGHNLLAPEAVSALRETLLPLADLLTPNLPEAAALLDTAPATTVDDMMAQGKALLDLGAKAVLMKGGHLSGRESPDYLIQAEGIHCFTGMRLPTHHTHGTGCTLSAALAALRPQHDNWVDTVAAAKSYLNGALAQADCLAIGHGIGPVHHFHRWWPLG